MSTGYFVPCSVSSGRKILHLRTPPPTEPGIGMSVLVSRMKLYNGPNIRMKIYFLNHSRVSEKRTHIRGTLLISVRNCGPSSCL